MDWWHHHPCFCHEIDGKIGGRSFDRHNNIIYWIIYMLYTVYIHIYNPIFLYGTQFVRFHYGTFNPVYSMYYMFANKNITCCTVFILTSFTSQLIIVLCMSIMSTSKKKTRQISIFARACQAQTFVNNYIIMRK